MLGAGGDKHVGMLLGCCVGTNNCCNGMNIEEADFHLWNAAAKNAVHWQLVKTKKSKLQENNQK